MSMNKAFDTYKKSNNEYVEGIESPHGRVKILFDTVIDNINNLIEVHPKTDFVSLGKCINAITVLAGSLNTEKGGDLANNLIELYDYSKRKLNEYLEDKNIKKLEEVKSIFEKLLEGWTEIDPKNTKDINTKI